jgi:hypothetical protein
MITKSPSHYDGKKVGAPCQLTQADDVLPIPVKRFQRLRREAHAGSAEAVLALGAHATKWLQRGAKLKTVAKKLGMSTREVIFLAMNYQRQYGLSVPLAAPRLVKRGSATHESDGF